MPHYQAVYDPLSPPDKFLVFGSKGNTVSRRKNYIIDMANEIVFFGLGFHSGGNIVLFPKSLFL